MARTFSLPRRRLPRVMGLHGFSGVGKDTLKKALTDEGFAVNNMSAGHFSKDWLMGMGLPLSAVTTDRAVRQSPHVLMPLNPAMGEHYSPWLYELELARRIAFTRAAALNEMELRRRLARDPHGTVVLNGYRAPAQHAMLRRLQREWGRDKVLLVRVVSPQLSKPPPGSYLDHLCQNLCFDVVIENDHGRPPIGMVRQLLRAL